MARKKQSIREAVQHEIERQQVTAASVAEAAGIPANTVYRWLRGEMSMTCSRIDKILHTLKMKVTVQ